MKRNLFASALMLLVALACSENNDPTPTRTQILSSHTWQITGGEVDEQPVSIDDCFQDDELTFFENGELRWRNNANKCFELQANTDIGTWEFSQDDTEFRWTAEGIDQAFEILELTNEIFRIEFKSQSGSVLHFEPIND